MVLVPNDTHYYTQEELQCMNMLKHPVWVFDIDTCSMYWANTAALVVWDASTLNELVLRDFQSDMSEAAISFLKNVKEKIHPKQNETISEQWTFYPRGMNATTIDITCSGIRIMGHSTSTTTTNNNNNNNQSNKKMKMMNETDATMDATTTSNASTSTTTNAMYVPRIAMLVEAEMLDKKQVIGEHMVRSIEILKHIPIAVSQFTMNGTILLHQNPKASNLFGNNHTNNSTTNNNTSSNTCTNTNASTTTTTATTTTTSTTRKRSNSCNTMNDNTSKHGTNNNNTDRATGNTSNYYNDIDDTTGSCDDNQNHNNILLNRFVDIEIGQKAIQMIQNSDDEYNDEVQQYCYYNNNNHNNNNSDSKNQDQNQQQLQQQQKRWFNISLRRARDPVTSNYVILYIAHDISDIVKARKDTLQAKMKSEFLNVMAHEIRTPLHQIIGHVDLIEDSILISNHNNKHNDINTNHTSNTNIEHQSTNHDCNSNIATNDHNKPNSTNDNTTTCMNCTINDKNYTHFNSNREHMLGSIQQIQISCSMLISIINDLLDCSKLENGQVQIEYIPFQLHTFIKECIDSMKPQLLSSTCTTTISTTTNTPNSITTNNSSNHNNTNSMKKQLNLTYTIDPKCCNYIISDMNRLRQIICNLLSNAIKFSFIGTISITVKPSSSDKSSSVSSHSVSSNNDDTTSLNDTTANATTSTTNNVKGDNMSCQQQSLRFEVSDTGIGIDPSEQSVIFERYRQANASVARQFGGTGLGLPICKGLVELLGGSIGLHSTVGVGTTVYFDIPVTIAKQDDKNNKNENQSGSILSYQSTNTATDDRNVLLQQPTPTSSIKSAITSVDGMNNPKVGLNVLVVEDNLVNQKVIKAMLQRLGHHVTIAENGQVAVNEIRRRQQSQSDQQSQQQQFFELILMDIQMPVMDGIECTTYIRNVLQYDKDQLPIIGLTAGYQPSDHNYYENEIGMNRCVGKPLPMESLKKAIASCYCPERTTVVTSATTSTSQTSNTDPGTPENIAL